MVTDELFDCSQENIITLDLTKLVSAGEKAALTASWNSLKLSAFGIQRSS